MSGICWECALLISHVTSREKWLAIYNNTCNSACTCMTVLEGLQLCQKDDISIFVIGTPQKRPLQLYTRRKRPEYFWSAEYHQLNAVFSIWSRQSTRTSSFYSSQRLFHIAVQMIVSKTTTITTNAPFVVRCSEREGIGVANLQLAHTLFMLHLSPVHNQLHIFASYDFFSVNRMIYA